MSDFFTRLADRALGQAETAQPVLAPRFAVPAPVEVEAGAVQPQSATRPQVHREAFEPGPVPTAPGDPPEIPVPVRTQPLRDDAPKQEPTLEPEKDEAEPGPPSTPSEPSRKPLANARGSETTVLSRDRKGAVVIASVALPEPAAGPPVDKAQAQSPLHPPKSPTAPPVHPSTTTQVSRPPSPTNRVEPLTPTQPKELDEAPTPVPLQQPVPMHAALPFEPPQVRPEVETAVPAARDVNVHIGRIEIRAAPPPTPPAPKPRTTLSLAEYLTMRNGDRR